MTTRRQILQAAAASSLLGLGHLPGRAQTRVDTLRVIVGFPPGGTTDAFARRVSEKLRGSYANTVLVDNKPGAGGQLGVMTLKKSGIAKFVANLAQRRFVGERRKPLDWDWASCYLPKNKRKHADDHENAGKSAELIAQIEREHHKCRNAAEPKAPSPTGKPLREEKQQEAD